MRRALGKIFASFTLRVCVFRQKNLFRVSSFLIRGLGGTLCLYSSVLGNGMGLETMGYGSVLRVFHLFLVFFLIPGVVGREFWGDGPLRVYVASEVKRGEETGVWRRKAIIPSMTR